MFKIIFALSLFGAALAGISPLQINSGGRIVGGHDAEIEDYPFVVSLQFDDWHRCGASILNENTLVTASHCTDGFENRFSIRAGSVNKSSEGQLIRVAEFFQHELYNTTTLDHDICILKLEKNLVFNEKVQPVALPEPWEDVAPGERCNIAGWGTLYFHGPSPEHLQVVDVPVTDREACGKLYSFIGENQVCAGETGRDSCQGDSGGGLVCNNKITGLVSWGLECAYEGYPTVHARVSAHIDWILNHMQ